MTSLDDSLLQNEHRTATLKKSVFPICYLSAVVLAMVGWLWAIGWGIFQAAKWLIT